MYNWRRSEGLCYLGGPFWGPIDPFHTGQWRGTLMQNNLMNKQSRYLRRNDAVRDVTAMLLNSRRHQWKRSLTANTRNLQFGLKYGCSGGVLLVFGVFAGIAIGLIHKSQNAPVPYPTMLHSEQKCTDFCFEWSIVGYGTGAFWDLWNWSTVPSILINILEDDILVISNQYAMIISLHSLACSVLSSIAGFTSRWISSGDAAWHRTSR